MTFVALATCQNIPEPDEDEPFLVGALADAGIPARVLAWDDDGVDWNAPRLTVIRSTWNYYLRPDAFLAWATARGSRLQNPPEVVRWNLHKRYLRELASRAVPVVPTLWIDQGTPIEGRLIETGWRDVVVKPAVSAGSHKTSRLRGSPLDEALIAELSRDGDVMVQPYVASVDDYGERSLVYIDGEVTHAIRKSPRLHGDREQVSEAVAIAPEEREIALAALACVAAPYLYARIDLVRDAAGRPMVSELEMTEPSLFLRQSPLALSRLVTAIGRRFALAT